MTAARRRDLHIPVNPGRWADHALRLGEFVAQCPRTATAHGRRLALDVRRACYPLLGGRVLGRLRQHHTCLCEANERCNDHNGQAQKAIPHTLTERVRQRPGARNTFPPPIGGGSVRAFDVCAKSGCRLWERGDSIGANRTNGDRWDRTMGGSIQIAAG